MPSAISHQPSARPNDGENARTCNGSVVRPPSATGNLGFAICEANMGDFTNLSVWRKAHDIALAVYRETAAWPKYELYGLTSQARRAAYSIPGNIAEGCGKNSDGELA